jgi:RsiW-degrading membrane proteinase PrsW (M82 family)
MPVIRAGRGRNEIYPLTKNDMRTISFFNDAFTFFSSVGSVAFTFLLQVVWNMSLDENARSSTNAGVLCVCVIVVVGCVMGMWWSRKERDSTIATIEKETVV